MVAFVFLSQISRISTIVVKIFGKLIFSKSASKIQLSLMKKIYPNMAYPEEIENYYMEDMPILPMKTLVKMYKTYMGKYRLKESITESKAQVLYIYGEKEMSCVKESAKLFQKMHP